MRICIFFLISIFPELAISAEYIHANKLEQLTRDFFPFQKDFSTNRNCLSYALNDSENEPVVDKSHFRHLKEEAITEKVKKILNEHYKDEEFSLVAPYVSGQLPALKEGYYIVAITYSFRKYHKKVDDDVYEDCHFLVMNSDETFSHKRGSHTPENVDSEGIKISNPEKSKFEYRFKQFKESKRLFLYDYKLVGYLYVKALWKRAAGIPALFATSTKVPNLSSTQHISGKILTNPATLQAY